MNDIEEEAEWFLDMVIYHWLNIMYENDLLKISERPPEILEKTPDGTWFGAKDYNCINIKITYASELYLLFLDKFEKDNDIGFMTMIVSFFRMSNESHKIVWEMIDSRVKFFMELKERAKKRRERRKLRKGEAS